MPRIIDLTLPLTNGMRGVRIDAANRLEVDGWNASTLTLYSHSGTHMDAPKHFLPKGDTIDRQPLTDCIGPAHVVDITPTAPRALINMGSMAKWADRIQAGDRVLLRSDWSKRLGTPAYRDELPRISLELANWFVERGIVLVGVEPPSVADVNNREELTAVHVTLLAGGVTIVEGLTNLDQISSQTVQLIILPLKIQNGDGAPARAIAIESE